MHFHSPIWQSTGALRRIRMSGSRSIRRFLRRNRAFVHLSRRVHASRVALSPLQDAPEKQEQTQWQEKQRELARHRHHGDRS